jgi:hypothetical protein
MYYAFLCLKKGSIRIELLLLVFDGGSSIYLPVVKWSDCLDTDPEVLGSIPAATKFSE